MNQSTTTMGTKLKVKIVLLGDQHVGKSCLIDKYINGKFDPNSSPTVGIDFLAKNAFHKGKGYRLQLWDTAGQERFRSLIPSYLKDAMSAIIVFDVTNKASLQNAGGWLQMFNDHKVNSGYSVLVGNKTDLPYRAVTTAEGRAVAEKLGVGYAEVSAKSGDKVDDLFVHLLDMLALGKTNGDVEIHNSTVSRQNSIQAKVETLTPKETAVPKTPSPMQVRMASSLPKENSTDMTQQPLSKQHDTIVKYPPPQHIPHLPQTSSQVTTTTVPNRRPFEKYIAPTSQPQIPLSSQSQIPRHYDQPQQIIIPPPPPAVQVPYLMPPITNAPITTNMNQVQPNIVLNSRVASEVQVNHPKKRCCRSS